jgi:hypothetical protein
MDSGRLVCGTRIWSVTSASAHTRTLAGFFLEAEGCEDIGPLVGLAER